MYEWRAVNNLNEEIIKKTLDDIPKQYDTYFLTAIPLNTVIKSTEEITTKIKKLTTQNFCYKDPRFAYTLPAWKSYVKDCKYIVMFREPGPTITSLARLAKISYDLVLSQETLVTIWKSYYEHILNQYDSEDWLFLHYNQIFEEKTLEKIRQHTGVSNLNESFPEKSLAKKYEITEIPECQEIYQRLCTLANY